MIPEIFAGERHRLELGVQRGSSRSGGGGEEEARKHQTDGFSVVLSAVMKDKLRCELRSLQHCPRTVGTVCRGNSVLNQGPGNVSSLGSEVEYGHTHRARKADTEDAVRQGCHHTQWFRKLGAPKLSLKWTGSMNGSSHAIYKVPLTHWMPSSRC